MVVKVAAATKRAGLIPQFASSSAMRLPRILAIRLYAAVPAVSSAGADAAVALNKFGLFSATLGALTSGSSQDDTLQLTHLGRQFGIKEKNKARWEGFQLGVCGLASTNFRSALDEVKRELLDAGLPMENVRIIFNHAIIGLHKSMELLVPMKWDLRDALLNAGFGVGCRVDVESDTFDFIAYKSEGDVWDVYSAFSTELQLERTQTHNTLELRAQLIEQTEIQAQKLTACSGIEKEASPSGSLKKRSYDPVVGRKRYWSEEGVFVATKSARVRRERDRAAVHPINLIDLLEKVTAERKK
ncbi:hypothetical protein PF010_g7313 [Phytophthora fragariae]|uniref:Uncharacterized protein n=2 Tax=Phytophthora fragariae TaxID=53985 RepID=A0A6A3TKP5_9STRA|nr:hypothetical protein PF009_g2384 [Phytophthora fragariae]KAE9120887.1 hypothetical protein PF010_g7313 [Phytophthora fragariae]KAE9138429.1 hypothetical protein PF007_g1388 [Phytophthora fragariae]